MRTFNGPQICMLVAGNTAKGVYKSHFSANVYADIVNIRELRGHKINENSLVLRANVTLTDALRTFKRLSMSNEGFEYLGKVAEHIDIITTIPVRNAVIKACDVLLGRMAYWKDDILECHMGRTRENLLQRVCEFVPNVYVRPKEEDLKPYKIYGVCASQVELDVLTGQYQITRLDLLQDIGEIMNPTSDIGQIEGAFTMGLDSHPNFHFLHFPINLIT
ncbi:hypothetical protein ABEB36_009694 [Hypothenemus hampei]|uniref:Aldehyde oxidase/xanthine dehydrogenase second molybdopterin binding domain-containing protein n=1 Tax=Hypothenemus hampei TaxID=57062 RepID=A0ABD1EHC4_HYPHA